ncbi:AMP-binding enzyme, partial [Ruegeria marina]|uniref:AMP-binding enzyme n=1 Tax=Ruegeria marina TaxID=639004 RepID=UPI003CCBF306
DDGLWGSFGDDAHKHVLRHRPKPPWLCPSVRSKRGPVHFGIPDAKFGEGICAWVVAKPGTELDTEELRAFCQGQIAHFKIPRHFRVVTELPMTVTGKPQKFVMRDRMIDLLAGGVA